MGNKSSRNSPRPIIISDLSGVNTYDKGLNSRHNLIKAFKGLDKHGKNDIQKSGIPAQCVVYEDIGDHKDKETYFVAEINKLLIQRLPQILSGSSTHISKTAKDLCKYGAAVFIAKSGKIYYYCGEDFRKSLFVYSVKAGRSVLSQDSKGNTTLHVCCMENNKAHSGINYKNDIIVSFLLTAGAKVNTQNNQGRTPLHLCLSNKWESLTSLLLQNGADVNIADRNGNIALHCFMYVYSHHPAMYNHFERYIKQCNPNIKNKSGMTPLHICYMQIANHPFAHHYCARKLLFLGANVNITNHHNKVPIQLLGCDGRGLEALELNIHAGLDVTHVKNFLLNLSEDFFDNLQVWQLKVCELMLECGAKPGILSECSSNEIYKQYRAMALCYKSKPLPLMGCSANVIRMSLKPNALVGIDHLNLPTALKNYINFSDRK